MPRPGSLRLLFLLVALTAFYVGVEECRLAFHCPARVALDAVDVASLPGDEPVWAVVSVPPVSVAGRIEPFRGEGVERQKWFAIVTGDEAGAPLVLRFPAGVAREGALDGALRLEGLAYRPGAQREARLRDAFGAVGVDLRRGFRLLEVGRQPAAGAGFAFVSAAGVLLFLVLRGGSAQRCRVGGHPLPRRRRGFPSPRRRQYA